MSYLTIGLNKTGNLVLYAASQDAKPSTAEIELAAVVVNMLEDYWQERAGD